jgi:hypothetical protein|tara:strand:- start:8071 stop:8349 length:279 start_codon:yes stop_codon:yes gene_type:complete
LYFVYGSFTGSPQSGDKRRRLKSTRFDKSKRGNFLAMEEQRQFITVKSITWFIIAFIVMGFYYFFINWGLMKVQGLDFFYLWSAGGGGGGGH